MPKLKSHFAASNAKIYSWGAILEYLGCKIPKYDIATAINAYLYIDSIVKIVILKATIGIDSYNANQSFQIQDVLNHQTEIRKLK